MIADFVVTKSLDGGLTGNLFFSPFRRCSRVKGGVRLTIRRVTFLWSYLADRNSPDDVLGDAKDFGRSNRRSIDEAKSVLT